MGLEHSKEKVLMGGKPSSFEQNLIDEIKKNLAILIKELKDATAIIQQINKEATKSQAKAA